MADQQRDPLTESEAVHAPETTHSAALQAGLAARIERAEAMARRFSTDDYGVDDFLRDKRVEAARER